MREALDVDHGAKQTDSEFIREYRTALSTTELFVYRKFKLPLDASCLADSKAVAGLRISVRKTAERTGVAFSVSEHNRDRSVIFLYDTDEFDLYRNIGSLV